MLLVPMWPPDNLECLWALEHISMGRIDIALTRTLLYFRRVSDGKEKDPILGVPQKPNLMA